jgi:hypothetical protein
MMVKAPLRTVALPLLSPGVSTATSIDLAISPNNLATKIPLREPEEIGKDVVMTVTRAFRTLIIPSPR